MKKRRADGALHPVEWVCSTEGNNRLSNRGFHDHVFLVFINFEGHMSFVFLGEVCRCIVHEITWAQDIQDVLK